MRRSTPPRFRSQKMQIMIFSFQRYSLVFGIILFVISACSKREDIPPTNIDENRFKVNSISKNKGMGGDIIEIVGTGFGDDASVVDVKFAISSPKDTLIADVVSIVPKQLNVRVPHMYTTEKISVFVVKDGEVSDKFPFTCDIDAVDSTLIVNSDWKITSVKDGIIWKTASLEAFESKQNIHVVEINQSKEIEMGLLYSEPVGTRKKTSVFANQVDATVAINGSYYSSGKASIGHLRVNGIDVEQGSNWNHRINASLAINNNKLSIHYLGTSDYNEKSRGLTGQDVMACGPSLLVDGVYLKTLKPDDNHVLARHPRTAVGVTADNKVLLVTVDGRQPGVSEGVNLREFSVIMRALKAKNAINLDGGGSTTMYIKGKGVVNKVSDPSERAVANALYVK